MVMVGENATAARVFYAGSGSEAGQDDKLRLVAGLLQLLTVSATTADKENSQPAGKPHSKKAKQAKAKKAKPTDDDLTARRTTAHRPARHTARPDAHRHTRLTMAAAQPRHAAGR